MSTPLSSSRREEEIYRGEGRKKERVLGLKYTGEEGRRGRGEGEWDRGAGRGEGKTKKGLKGRWGNGVREM